MRLTLLALAVSLVPAVAVADQTVRGHVRSDGTYVAPHARSDANQYRYDNFSAQGNVNPYTGEAGHRRHEFTNPPEYNKSFDAPVRSRPRY